MSFRKNILIVLAIIALSMLLIMQLIGTRTPQTSSGNNTPEPASEETSRADEEADKIIRLNAVVHMSPEDFQAFANRRDSVRSVLPNVQVELTNVTEDGNVMTFYREQARLGISPDIMLLNNEYVSEFAAAGYLSHQLERYIPVRSSKLDGQIGWNGYTWAVPYEHDPYVIISNMTEAGGFAEGEALPTTVEGWQQLRDKRTAEGRQEGLIHIEAQDPFALVSLIWALGGEWTQADNGMLQLSSESVPLLGLLYGGDSITGQKEAFAPLLVTQPLSSDDKWEQFEQGLIPIMVVRLSELKARGGDSYLPVTALVKETAEEGLWAAGTSFAVSSVSEHPGEAFAWIEAMRRSDDTVPETMIRTFNQDPELRLKLAMLAFLMPELARGMIPVEETNSRLSELWSAR